MVDSDSTIGVWAGEDVEMIEEFDRYFTGVAGNYSRSTRIKEAMEIYLVCHREIAACDELGDPEDIHRRELKALLRARIKYGD